MFYKFSSMSSRKAKNGQQAECGATFPSAQVTLVLEGAAKARVARETKPASALNTIELKCVPRIAGVNEYFTPAFI